MIVEAAKAGLGIEYSKARVVLGKEQPTLPVKGLPKFAAADADRKPHDSLHGPWWLLEYLWQKDPHLPSKGWGFPRGALRDIPDESYIHESAFMGKHDLPALVRPQIEPWVHF
jgi:hypothetical protein